MFLEPSRLPFARHLERHADVIHDEAARLDEQAYEAWRSTQAYTGGGWSLCTLFSRDEWDYGERARENARRCPRTLELVQRIPGLLLAGFSRLEPGTHILSHRDEMFAPSVRCQLGLMVNPGACLRSANETRVHRRGRCIVFDGALPHEVANLGHEPRIVLVVDVPVARLAEPVRAS